MVYVLLADGFEEMEAMAPIDLLRRAGCETVTVAVTPNKTVIGAHAIPVVADIMADEVAYNGLEAVILPGGMPGTTNLDASPTVHALIEYADKQQLVLGAICAAPSVLGKKGLLRGKRATCYPGFENMLLGADVDQTALVVTDGCVVTSRGAGAATEFGLALVSLLVSPEKADELREGIQCK